MNGKSCAGALMALVLSATAQAAVIHTSHTVTGIPPGAVGDPFNPVHAPGGPSSTDLINGLLPIASGPGDFQLESSEGLVALTNGSIGTFVGEVARTSTMMGALDHPLHPWPAPVPARGIPLDRGASTHQSGHRIGWVKRP